MKRLLVICFLLMGCSLTFQNRYPSHDISDWPARPVPMLTATDGERIEENGDTVRIYLEDRLKEIGILRADGSIDLYDMQGHRRRVQSNYVPRWAPRP